MADKTPYFLALCEAMRLLSMDPRTFFVGQGVGCAGTFMTDTLRDVPKEKLLEFPVAEDLQLGFCTGLSLKGFVPVSIFPRWNFLVCAANQLVNHLDKLPLFSDYHPKVIIRTAAPSSVPIDPGPQHMGNYSVAFRSMLETVDIVDLYMAESIVPAYAAALASRRSTILVESMAAYGWSTPPSGVSR